jgi:hypothetical protein
MSVLLVATLGVPLAHSATTREGARDAARLRLVASSVDITDTPGSITDEHGTGGAEGPEQAIDGAPYRRYFTANSTGWVQFVADTPATVTGYTLTSGGDNQASDPRSWVFEASGDGDDWDPLDSRSDETFVARFARRTFSFANTTAYRHYRLRVTATGGGSSGLQLGEWQILGMTAATTPPPAAPSGLTMTPVSGDQVRLSWTDNSRWETAYRLQRSLTGTGGWVPLGYPSAGTTRFYDGGLAGDTTYHYRLRAEHLGGFSDWVTGYIVTPSATPPATWSEVLHQPAGANETLTHVVDDGLVSLYRDPQLAGTDLTWAKDYVKQMWDYVRLAYRGTAGRRLYVALHDGPSHGGTARVLFDWDSEYRNLIDAEGDGWTSSTAPRRDVLSHELGHVIESAAAGVHLSPAWAIWDDSKWCEIFQYDVYLNSGLTADAQRWYDAKINWTDDFPHAGTQWFKNWFYPIYDLYGGRFALNRFFVLLADHFHVFDGHYQRSLNWGEFVHFWSGAAQVDLKPRAMTAFGWPAEWEAQYQQARVDFPGVTYS